MIPLALAALAATAAAAPAEACRDDDRYFFRVERLHRPGTSDAVVDGLEVHADAGAPHPVHAASRPIRGLVRFCLAGRAPGDTVRLSLRVSGAQPFRLVHPQGPVALTREEPLVITVCQQGIDCDVSFLEARELLARSDPGFARLAPGEKAGLVVELKDALAAQRFDTRRLIEELLEKQRRGEVLRKAATLLAQFDNRAREITERFKRHAQDALDGASVASLEAIREAAVDYNPVFQDLKENGGSYRASMTESWGPKKAHAYQALLDDALDIHYKYIFPLNETLRLISVCRRNGPECGDRGAVRQRIAEASLAMDQVDRRRDDLIAARRAFVAQLESELYDAPAGPAAPGGEGPSDAGKARRGGKAP